ncbi:MAG: hypothetical protein KC646_10605 [Candidatus Cloacimonetes bacterium]|nr:hypothetical protein [Candidatus Cloacimonadota bacterium]
MSTSNTSNLALDSFSLRMKDQNRVIDELITENPNNSQHYKLFQKTTIQLDQLSEI